MKKSDIYINKNKETYRTVKILIRHAHNAPYMTSRPPLVNPGINLQHNFIEGSIIIPTPDGKSSFRHATINPNNQNPDKAKKLSVTIPSDSVQKPYEFYPAAISVEMQPNITFADYQLHNEKDYIRMHTQESEYKLHTHLSKTFDKINTIQTQYMLSFKPPQSTELEVPKVHHNIKPADTNISSNIKNTIAPTNTPAITMSTAMTVAPTTAVAPYRANLPTQHHPQSNALQYLSTTPSNTPHSLSQRNQVPMPKNAISSKIALGKQDPDPKELFALSLVLILGLSIVIAAAVASFISNTHKTKYKTSRRQDVEQRDNNRAVIDVESSEPLLNNQQQEEAYIIQ